MSKPMKKVMNNHPEWRKLALKHDDYKFILLTFKEISPKVRKALINAFKYTERKLYALENKLDSEGWVLYEIGKHIVPPAEKIKKIVKILKD